MDKIDTIKVPKTLPRPAKAADVTKAAHVRDMETTGIATQGEFVLRLREVYVDVSLRPHTPQGSAAAPYVGQVGAWVGERRSLRLGSERRQGRPSRVRCRWSRLCRARTRAGWLTWVSTLGSHVPPTFRLDPVKTRRHRHVLRRSMKPQFRLCNSIIERHTVASSPPRPGDG